ncbi:hypothetical protein HMF8227_02949 [Saliniradius amylolyticus]|uniref:TIGR02647 family protein n=1 Tax=Saliniradius amylolyticus TaxID=2183582 RepID=A0A2S2E904_9ALTE|nr:TIGR02647 family protein [Saliniradius amylolyticus]AWL13397.1 hypothetical protein HMF8227_02949 [Saliniradius amylolyticus]
MAFNPSMIACIDLLMKFPTDTLHQGIKLHRDADPELIDAAKRLHQIGAIDQPDGGYLTDLGHDLAEHAQILITALKSA